ncbi:MAG: GNAT family N-acetyltransferase [Muribaculaceae bacterium]
MNTKMTFDSEFEIRPMREADNKSIACYIRAVIDEHKASRTNSVYDDPTTDCVFQTFEGVNAQYWVLDHNGSVVGGCGYFPTNGLPLGCAEIVKFYILPEARGHNYGATLLDLVINQAKKAGYNQLYLETVPSFAKAIDMYCKRGFKFLDRQICDNGHSAPNVFMVKSLD